MQICLSEQCKKKDNLISNSNIYYILRQGLTKKKKVEFSTKGLTPAPPVSGKKKCKIQSITQFSENFEEKIIICHIVKDITIEIK